MTPFLNSKYIDAVRHRNIFSLVTFMGSGDILLLIPREGCELIHSYSEERGMIQSTPRFKEDFPD